MDDEQLGFSLGGDRGRDRGGALPDVDPALIRYFPSPQELSAFDRDGHG